MNSFHCGGCGRYSAPHDVVRRFRDDEDIRTQITEQQKILRSLDSLGIHLNDITNALIRIENLLQDISKK